MRRSTGSTRPDEQHNRAQRPPRPRPEALGSAVPRLAMRRRRAWPRLMRRLRGGEEGQILLLGIGMVTLILALLLVTASATAVYLDLKALTSMADSAAAAGAAGVGGQPYYGGGVPDAASGALTSQAVRAAALEDLAAQAGVVDGVGLSGVELVSAQAQEGSTAVVTLRAHCQPPFLPWGIIPAQGFTLTATGTAAITTVP